MDKPVVVARKVLENAIRSVQDGRDPPNVVRDPKLNRFVIVSTDDILPSSKDWRDYIKELEALVNV